MVKSVTGKEGNSYKVATSHLITTCATLAALLLFVILGATHPGWASVVLSLDIKGKNLRNVFSDKRVYGRTYADAKDQKTIFDFEAVKVVEDTVLKPEEKRIETFTVPTPKDTKTFDVEATLSYAPVTGPAAFLQRIEAESSKGAQDPVFQSIEIVKYSENIPVNK